MEHWERFLELAITQMFVVSNELPLAEFEDWLLLAVQAKNNKQIQKSVIFFEKGRSENDIIDIHVMHNKLLPNRKIELVRGVPSEEIQKMVDLVDINNDVVEEILK